MQLRCRRDNISSSQTDKNGYPMDELSVYQKLDMVEALVRYHGGRFKYLSNKIPAYKMPEGEWQKIDIQDKDFHLKAQESVGLKFTAIPSSRALLGGIARHKDKYLMMLTLQSVIGREGIGRAHPSVISEHIANELVESGFVFHSRDSLKDTIQSWVERDRDATNFIAEGLLRGAGNEGFWPDHHARYNPERFNPDLYEPKEHLLYLKRRDLVDKAIVATYMDNPYSELDFLTRVQGMLCHSNLGVSIHHERASAENPGADVLRLLKEAFKGSNGGGNLSVLESALQKLNYQYDGLEVNRRTISPEQGIEMLRAAIKNNPNQETSKPSKVEDFRDELELKSSFLRSLR